MPALDSSVGARMRAGDGYTGAISALVDQVRTHQSALDAVRGPTSPEATEHYERFMQLAAEVRGRGLIYPYVGSGLGNGPFVELADGSVKLDLITGIGVNFFGHSDLEMLSVAIRAATADVAYQGNLLMNEEAIRFAETLIRQARAAGAGMDHAFLCAGGALANEHTLKVCFQKRAPKACRILAFSHCFMGRTWAMAQIGDSAGGRDGLPLNVHVDYMPFFDPIAAKRLSAGDVSGETRFTDMAVWHLEEYLRRYPDQHACFIFELIQGEGGFNVAPTTFHRALMDVCKAHSVPVWDDEVQTFGRTTRMFACETLGVSDLVDVITVGKMSQVCAVLMSSDMNPRAGLLSGTFLGSSIGLQTGRAGLVRLAGGDHYGDDGLIARHHAEFRAGVQAIADRHPEWFPRTHEIDDIVGGLGGMCRFTPFGGDKAAITKTCKQLFDDGVIAFYCGHGPFHLRFLPPLGVMTLDQWAPVFEIVEKSLGTVAASLRTKRPPPVRPMAKPYTNT
ncbi:MAG: aminotransferase class III-fold pyridoxal phosphate-dependent enzyme [Planctomycetota bacterium]